MMKGDHGQTKQLHDINWGTFSHAPLLMLCNYYVCVCACVQECTYVCVLMYEILVCVCACV